MGAGRGAEAVGKRRWKRAARPWRGAISVATVGRGVACAVVEASAVEGLTACRRVSSGEDSKGTLENESADLAEGNESWVRGMKHGITWRSVVHEKLNVSRGECACP